MDVGHAGAAQAAATAASRSDHDRTLPVRVMTPFALATATLSASSRASRWNLDRGVDRGGDLGVEHQCLQHVTAQLGAVSAR